MNKLLALLKELGKAFNVPDEKIDALVTEDIKLEDLKSDDLAKLFGDAYREKMSSIMKTHNLEKEKSKNEGYQAAERKIKTDVEKLIKDKLKLDDAEAETLDELLDIVATRHAEKPSKKAADLTDDDVKKHPAFLQAERAWKKQIQDAKDAAFKALNDLKAGYAKKETFATVGDKALAAFDALKPILSTDPTRAANQRADFLRKLEGYDYEIVDGVVIISRDGQVMEDDLKNKVTLETLVKQVAEPLYDFKVADDRQSTHGAAGNNGNNGNNQQQPGMKYTGALPKNQQELLKLTNDQTIPLEQRQEIMAWGEKNLSAA